jgi:hypothetical protein
MLSGVEVAGSDLAKVGARFTKCKMVRTRDDIYSVQVESVVLPKTDGTNLVLTPLGKGEIVASRALMDGGERLREFRHTTDKIWSSLVRPPTCGSRVKNRAAYQPWADNYAMVDPANEAACGERGKFYNDAHAGLIVRRHNPAILNPVDDEQPATFPCERHGPRMPNDLGFNPRGPERKRGPRRTNQSWAAAVSERSVSAFSFRASTIRLGAE